MDKTTKTIMIIKETKTIKKGNKGEQKDPTVADTKIPQTGSLLYIAGVAIIALGITGIVAYKKGKHLNFK